MINCTFEACKWDTAGGFLDRDETVEQGASREVLEETGYEVKSIRMIGINSDSSRPHEDRQNVEFIFAAEIGDKVQEPDDESSEMKWFGRTELPDSSKIAFDHGRNLEWFVSHPGSSELLLIGFSTE